MSGIIWEFWFLWCDCVVKFWFIFVFVFVMFVVVFGLNEVVV